jgi:hypothetical protein
VSVGWFAEFAEFVSLFCIKSICNVSRRGFRKSAFETRHNRQNGLSRCKS